MGNPGLVRRRKIAYGLLAGLLIAGFLLLRGVTWVGSTSLHTIMEVAATLLATMVGIMALVRYFVERSTLFLFLGSGFLGTALLDGYHAAVTSEGFHALWPSPPSHLIPWSWSASRTFLSVLMVLSWWVSRPVSGSGGRREIAGTTVLALTGILTLGSFTLFALVPLPRAYQEAFPLGRPQELVAALFFGVALAGYLRRGGWKEDTFEHWVVLSLIVGVVSQALFMPLSFRLFDGMFDLAHVLKKVSYVLVLTGLFISMYAIFRKAQEGAENLRTMLDASPSPTLGVDGEGRIRMFNRAAEKLFGYAPDEITGEPVERLVPEGIRRESFQDSPVGGRRDSKGLRKDGTEVPVSISLSPVDLEGERLVLAGVMDLRSIRRVERELRKMNETLESRIRERTVDLEKSRAAALNMMQDAQEARKQAELAEEALRDHAEELARSNADLENFAYVASHDLKSPLRAIDNLSTWLAEDLEDKLNAETRGQINLLRGRVKRMEAMIDGLLQYSRAGRTKYDEVEVPVGDLVRDIRDTINLREGLTVEAVGEMPVLRTQRPPLQQVLQNLIENAVKHHDRPEGRVEVRCTPNGSFCEFSVRDDGPGISEQYHGKVFQMFQTLKSRDAVESTGIGLALVKRIVEQLGGRVSLVSDEGKGSDFRFQWPMNGGGRKQP